MTGPGQGAASTPKTPRSALSRTLRRLAGRPERRVRADPQPVATVAEFDRRVSSGESAAAVAVDLTRQLLAEGRQGDALVFGYRILGRAESRDLGEASLGLTHLHRSGPEQAWQHFSVLADAELVANLGTEYFAAACGVDPTTAEERSRWLLSSAAADQLTQQAALSIAQNGFSVGLVHLASELVRAAQQGRFGELTAEQEVAFERLSGWLPGGSHTNPVTVQESTFRFGVLNYRQPDYSSSNVGDFIQTLASLGHLARRDQLSFVGDKALVDFMASLRGGIRPELRVPGEPATVQLVEVHRDGSVYQELPEPTWVFSFGWYLHPTFAGGYNLPFHPALRPIFISFHLNKPDALTPEAIDYLRRFGPVGCRDWQTVALLTAVGVPAFFSGCITTTVNTVFADTDTARSGTLHVDDPSRPIGENNLAQAIPAVRCQSLTTNLELARDWVGRYQQVERVVTRRLHSYLPARSVGCQVSFQPENPSDPRFGGLIAINDDEFEAIRAGILPKLGIMLDLLASSTPEAEVYQRWQELCAEEVAASARRLAAEQLAEQPLGVAALELPTTDRVVIIDAPAPARNLKRLSAALAKRAPGVPVLLVGAGAAEAPAGTYAVSSLSAVGDPATASTHDQLMAAVLGQLSSAGVERALILSRFARLTRDLSDRLDADFGTAVIIARPEVRRNRRDLNSLLRRVSARQKEHWPAAVTFLAAAHRHCGPGGTTFDPSGALVSLSGLERAGWSNWAGSLIGNYHTTWSEALNVVLAGQWRPLSAHDVCSIALEPAEPAAAIVNWPRGTALGWADVFGGPAS